MNLLVVIGGVLMMIYTIVMQHFGMKDMDTVFLCLIYSYLLFGDKQ